MKRFLVSVILSCLLCVSATACGSSSSESDSSAEASTLAPLTESKVDTSAIAISEASEDSVGNVVFYPTGTSYLAALSGTNSVTVYFEKEGITAGNGFMALYNADTQNKLAYVQCSNEQYCTVTDIDDNGKNLTGWDSGTMATIYFDYYFTSGESYYILLDPGCFSYGTVDSKEVTNASLITFSAKDYGFSGSITKEYEVGSTVSLSVILGGDAVLATVKDYDESLVSVSGTTFDVTSDLKIDLLSDGIPTVTIDFFDSSGQSVDSVTFTFYVGDYEQFLSDDSSTSDSSDEGSSVSLFDDDSSEEMSDDSDTGSSEDLSDSSDTASESSSEVSSEDSPDSSDTGSSETDENTNKASTSTSLPEGFKMKGSSY